MRFTLGLTCTIPFVALASAGTPVRGTLYLEKAPPERGVYRAVFAYDGEGTLSVCEPTALLELPRLGALFEVPGGGFTFPRAETCRPILTSEPNRITTTGTVDSRLSYDRGEPPLPTRGVLHVGCVDLDVPPSPHNFCATAPQLPPPPRERPLAPDGGGGEWKPGDEAWAKRLPISSMGPDFDPTTDSFSDSMLFTGGNLVRQVRFDNPTVIASTLHLPEGYAPDAMIADGHGRLFGIDPIWNEIVIVDYSETGVIGDGTTIFSVGAIRGVTGFSGQMVVRLVITRCEGDTSGDCLVDLSDVTCVLLHYGKQRAPEESIGDADANGIVDARDIRLVLANFGALCP